MDANSQKGKSVMTFLKTPVDPLMTGVMMPLYRVILKILGFTACVVCAVALSRFLFEAAMVRGSSMQPTLCDGECYLAARQFSEKSVKTGSIVCIQITDGVYASDKRFVKRVVGIPGDFVEICSGILYVNGKESPYQFDYIVSAGIIGSGGLRLGRDEYFVMGDNRNNSTDSRIFGAVRFDEITNIVFTKFRIRY